MEVIYRRTSKGDEEIQKRTYKLNHVYRFVLIMVDGKASISNIISRSSEQWNSEQCLTDLEINGFIENTDLEVGKASEVCELKQALLFMIHKHLPENNSKLTNKILNAKMSKPAIIKAIDSGCMFIKLTISEEIAQKLKVDLHNIVDSSSEFS